MRSIGWLRQSRRDLGKQLRDVCAELATRQVGRSSGGAAGHTTFLLRVVFHLSADPSCSLAVVGTQQSTEPVWCKYITHYFRSEESAMLVNRGSFRGPENESQTDSAAALYFRRLETLNAGIQGSYAALYLRALRFEFEEGIARGAC